MPEERLQRALSDLHQRLAEAGELSDQDRAALVETLEDIQQALGRKPTATSAPDSALRDRLYNLVEELESAHPKLAEVLHNVSESLANLGI